jgi:ketosteroid isomerase-like protein
MRRGFLLFSTLIAAIAFATSCERPAGNSANKPANANANATTTTDSAANEAEVRKFITDFGATMSKNDVVVLDKMWADDFTFVSHDGEILTKAQLLEVLRSGTEKFESVTFDDVNVRIYGDTAVVRAHGTQKASLEGKDHSGATVVSIVLVKSKDGWHMVLAQLSELKPAAKNPESNNPNRS